ncbi:MAG: hypothetical protein WC464_00155 [Bdellovibrionales bacterium]|jgi:5-methylthioribose kinase
MSKNTFKDELNKKDEMIREYEELIDEISEIIISRGKFFEHCSQSELYENLKEIQDKIIFFRGN